MGNHQTCPKRQHRPSESVGFNKQETDGDHLVTIQRRSQRISTKSAPPLDEINTKINPDDCKLIDFSIPAMPFDTHACVTGTFTDWNEYKMTKSDGEYQAHILVSHGCHYYQILVNGRQRFIPNEAIESHSKFGSVHFLYVNTSDTNVNTCFDRTILSLHTSHIWSQDVNNQLNSIDQSPPPRMPPHLLNILLNHKLPEHCDPNVLPEPNSVMLQHLYALSIQNGIMILSSTVRHKQKFVTTLFYKPN